ncbi:GTP cyclohydrolase II [Acidocella sp.]|uniref:GTP cyclohydrolase II n=1 Tax=Acidocella sp. TaxID=50710 RepID=UPI003D003665
MISSRPPFQNPLSTPRTRAVHRAIADARRGVPVVLAARKPLILAPAETVGAEGLRLLDVLSTGEASLLLAPSRAAAVLKREMPDHAPAIALKLARPLIDTATLKRAADPTMEQILPHFEMTEAPEEAQAALALGKLARLLPAMVAAPVRPGWATRREGADLLTVPAADLLAYPLELASTLMKVAEVSVPLDAARDARLVAFRALDQGIEHMAILVGEPEKQETPLVRLHSECFTGDLLGSLRCDCGPQLQGAIARMGREGHGAVLYLAQEGRGIGLINKLRAYTLQDEGLDTVDANKALGWQADERNFHIAAAMLEALGIGKIRLLTNNPGKVESLAACGIDIVERVPHKFEPNGVNNSYLETKARRFGHLLG